MQGLGEGGLTDFPGRCNGGKTGTTVLLTAEILHHLGWMKPYKQRDKHLSTGAGFQPSTVSFWRGLVKYLHKT